MHRPIYFRLIWMLTWGTLLSYHPCVHSLYCLVYVQSSSHQMSLKLTAQTSLTLSVLVLDNIIPISASMRRDMSEIQDTFQDKYPARKFRYLSSLKEYLETRLSSVSRSQLELRDMLRCCVNCELCQLLYCSMFSSPNTFSVPLPSILSSLQTFSMRSSRLSNNRLTRRSSRMCQTSGLFSSILSCFPFLKSF